MNDRSIRISNEWCVGEPPVRWDVPFGSRITDQLRRIFLRVGDRRVEIRRTSAEGKKVLSRKAA